MDVLLLMPAHLEKQSLLIYGFAVLLKTEWVKHC